MRQSHTSSRIALSQFSDTRIPGRKPKDDFILARHYADLDQLRGRIGAVHTNVPHKVVFHSPSGFEWGYGGSGPADLALNILETVLLETGYKGKRSHQSQGRCFDLAVRLHQDFKRDFIATIPKDGTMISFERTLRWINDRRLELGEDLE